jgi:hypothetical protein
MFSGADDSLKIQACITALGILNSKAGIADGRNLSGSAWSVDPFAVASPPGSGWLFLPGRTIATDVPVVARNKWSIRGVGPVPIAGQVGTVLQASANFRATYATGTITSGTAGLNDVITGSGTSWSTSTISVGCAFVAPAGGPTASSTPSTYGIISAIGGTTSITLAYGTDNAGGAGVGSTYDIYCPVYLHGNGGNSSHAQFGMAAEEVGFDCNNVAGCVPEMNWYGQQGTYAKGVTVRGFTNIGLDVETSDAQQSGPWSVISIPGTACTSTAIPIVFRTGSGTSLWSGLQNFTLSGGNCSGGTAVGVDVQSDDLQISGGDMEQSQDGVAVGANTACPVACPKWPRIPQGVEIDNVYNISSLGTNVVHLSNGVGAIKNALVRNVAKGASVTNILLDDTNSCTSTQANLGQYVLNNSGKIVSSTDTTASCRAINAPVYMSASGAASTPGLSVTGSPYTSGNATTNTPQLYLFQGSAPSTWSTAGTELGVNTPSGFTGNMLDFHVNGGGSVASLDYAGNANLNSLTVAKGQSLTLQGGTSGTIALSATATGGSLVIGSLGGIVSASSGTISASTSPALGTPTATSLGTSSLLDANGNPFLASSATASAVDSITITNAATASPATVTIAGSGSDNGVGVTLRAKDASANAVLGTTIVRGANETGAGGATSKGGNFLAAGGNNAATNTGSGAGIAEVSAGASTGASNTGIQGLLLLTDSYAQSGTVTATYLACFTSTAKAITDCAASPTNIAGVTLSKSGSVQATVAEAPSDVPVAASAAVTLGDTVCAGTTAGKVTDSGGTAPCVTGVTIGTVIATSSTGYPAAFPDGTSFPSLSTTLPLVKLHKNWSSTTVNSQTCTPGGSCNGNYGTVTQYNTLVGGASGTIASVAPSATAGVPLVSGGSSANPSYTTAVVAGGGTGATSFTAYAPVVGGTTTTGALQSTAAGTAKQVLTSGGTGAIPAYIDFPAAYIIPAAYCNNATAGSRWSVNSSFTATCRAGTNNLNGVLNGTPSAGTAVAYFDMELPGDWDTTVKPYINIHYASGANTSGTVIWTVSTACTKADGSVTDDPAWVAESAMGTQTMVAANRMWAQSAELAGAMTNCVAGGTMYFKLALTGTASSAIQVSKAVVTVPRLLTVQAD